LLPRERELLERAQEALWRLKSTDQDVSDLQRAVDQLRAELLEKIDRLGELRWQRKVAARRPRPKRSKITMARYRESREKSSKLAAIARDLGVSEQTVRAFRKRHNLP
jgi:uncharacterized protein YjcR